MEKQKIVGKLSPFVRAGLGVVVTAVALAAAWWKLEPALRGESRVKLSGTQMLARLEREGHPQFTTPTLAGDTFDSRVTYGSVAIYHFWASWCGPCIEEFPHLVKLVEHFRGELKVIAIATQDTDADVERFLKQARGSTNIRDYSDIKGGLVIAMDPNSAIAESFGTTQLPESYIVGRNGRVRRKLTSSIDWMNGASIKALGELIAEPQPAQAPPSEPKAESDSNSNDLSSGVCKANDLSPTCK